MKRKRWLAMALVFCLLGTTVPLTALAAGEDGEVQYIVSNDGTTLTIQGDGEITSQALARQRHHGREQEQGVPRQPSLLFTSILP